MFFRSLLLAIVVFSSTTALATTPLQVTTPPESFFELFRESQREVARDFYAKYLNVGGLSIVSSSEVHDSALLEAAHVVRSMLRDRPDILEQLGKNKVRPDRYGNGRSYLRCART